MIIDSNYESEIDYKDDTYVNILEFFLNTADTFEFVIRTDIDFTSDDTNSYYESAYSMLSELSTYIFETKMTQKWAASSTIYSPAKVYKGLFNKESLNIILSHTSKFSDWQGPEKPDDLSLFKDNQRLLSIIGHESLGFWNLGLNEFKELNSLNPSLELEPK